jgi:HK97 gp10 family phage protein
MQVVRVEGLRELAQALEDLPKATARNTIKRALKKAAQPVEDAMESRAPVDTGYTSKSIGTSFTLNPAQKRDARKETKAFAEIHVGSRRGSAAGLQEYGTINQPAHPYLRPGWEATKDGALKTIASELATEIEKTAARRARKLAKG